MKKHISLLKKIFRPALAGIGLAFFLTFSSGAFAQCEAPQGVSLIAEAAVSALEVADIQTMNAAIISANTIETAAAQLLLAGIPGTPCIEGVPAINIEMMECLIVAELDWFWDQWHQALKDMTMQLNEGIIDQTRQIASNVDGDNITKTALEIQNAEYEGKKLYQPSNQACRFDTTAKYLGHSTAVSDAVAAGYAGDFSRVGNNEKGSPAAAAAAGLQKTRWATYQSKFCDSKADNGNAGCTTALANVNMHIMPSKTIFAKETIDLTDANTRDAVTELLFNITGYQPADPLAIKAQVSARGLEQRQENREYLAQMDAIAALAASVVAERAPGQTALEVQEMRNKVGVSDASATPSEREIRQAIIEELRDPNYYQELYDNPSTIPQKEVYLKAYSLALLYKMIEKQEKISNVYAIETANMLEKANTSGHNASAQAPLK